MNEPRENRTGRTLQETCEPGRFFVAMGMAGATYPVVVYLVLAVRALVENSGAWAEDPRSEGILYLAVASAIGCFGGVIGSLFSLLFCTALCATLGLPTGGPRFGAFTGGVLGVFPIFVILVLVPHQLPAAGDWGGIVVFFLLGPGTVTLIFQLAGAWSEWPAEGVLPRSGVRQFGIRQVLSATVWMALALTVAKLVGWLSLWVGGWFLAWLVTQSLTMWLVLKFMSWRGLLATGEDQPQL